jgi:fatty acid desaturase
MTTNTNEPELRERLNVIETMIAEGRRSTESFAWTLILWGVAYYVAIAWSTWGFGWAIWGHHIFAWPVTMACTFVLTWVLALRKYKNSNQPSTTLSRAISSIWIAMGISMFTLLFSLGLSGRSDQHVFVAVIAAMMGTTNAASGMILRWKQQLACAAVWWLAAVVSCFGTIAQTTIAFLVAIFFCQIVFGIYGMITEVRMRRQRETAHA